MIWLMLAALLAAGVQGYFAYLEWFRWDIAFVQKAAPDWIDAKATPETTVQKVEWAHNLARNVAAYNLLVALGLAFTAYAAIQHLAIAAPLGLLLGLFLLGAAAAAAHTKVYLAMKLQGALGVILLLGTWATSLT